MRQANLGEEEFGEAPRAGVPRGTPAPEIARIAIGGVAVQAPVAEGVASAGRGSRRALFRLDAHVFKIFRISIYEIVLRRAIF